MLGAQGAALAGRRDLGLGLGTLRMPRPALAGRRDLGAMLGAEVTPLMGGRHLGGRHLGPGLGTVSAALVGRPDLGAGLGADWTPGIRSGRRLRLDGGHYVPPPSAADPGIPRLRPLWAADILARVSGLAIRPI